MSFLKVTGAESIFRIPPFSISNIARPLSTNPEESNRKIPSTPEKPLGLVKASLENVSRPSLLALNAFCAKNTTKQLNRMLKTPVELAHVQNFF